MKIKIDENGHLWLERAGKMRKVKCPKDHYIEYSGMPTSKTYKHWECGDWCALWSDYVYMVQEEGRGVEKQAIALCHVIHRCDLKDFTDERERGE